MGEYKLLKLLLGGHPILEYTEGASEYASVEALLAENSEPAIIFIDGAGDLSNTENSQELIAAVGEIRKTAVFCYSPIFFTQSGGANLDSISDGVTADVPLAVEKGEAILDRGKNIHIEKLSDNYNLRLLSYMYTRGDTFFLKPVCTPFSSWVYSYPEAAMLMDSELKSSKKILGERGQNNPTRSFAFDDKIAASVRAVDALLKNEYIEQAELVNRIRMCPKCETGHLNYVDCCPQCGSKNFDKKVMLHCFTCGHVAPENDFVNNMALVCPKCGTVLRHIGSDYDHPLESYECVDCGARFIEPDVKVECFNCGAVSQPNDLSADNIYSYRITEKGANAVKRGTMQVDIRLFDDLNNVVLPYFCKSAEWLIQLRDRYPEDVFSLLGIKFSGVYEASEAIGEDRFNELMMNLAERLRELVRATDITTSSAPDTFWILLPHTPLENCKVIEDRVKALADMIAVNGVSKIGINAKAFNLPKGTTGDDVLRRIKAFSEGLSPEE